VIDRPVVLIVRDGWGVRAEEKGNGIAAARTPRLDGFLAEYPYALLNASEHYVGLPDGQMGNSEVGHLNIGAGRVVYQDFSRINKDIAEGGFFENQALVDAVDRAHERNRALHLVGLISDGGVHSHQDQLYALLELAKRRGMTERVYVHAISDGRDTSPTGGIGYLESLLACFKRLGVGQLASVCGRYFTMDRDTRWDRVKRGYDLMVHGRGSHSNDPLQSLRDSYSRGVTDEFLEPIVLCGANEEPVATICRGDQVLFFNFRADRARQICGALASEDFDSFDREGGPVIELTGLTRYSESIPFTGVAYPPSTVKNHLAATIGGLGLSQFKCAETEKYAHVTFFFNGGEERACPGEERLLVPSPRVATYDLQPEMSAGAVADGVVARLKSHDDALLVVNFANTDMVGHSGNFDAVVRAVEVVDDCVGRICDAIQSKQGAAFITADHGNAEKMLDDDGGPFTAHTRLPVHGILVSKAHRDRKIRAGALSDIAPTLLEILGLETPTEMTASSLLK